MNKEQLLNELENDIYCRLVAADHGVGLVAIKKIPKGTDPFKGCMPTVKYVPVEKHIIDDLSDDQVKQMVIDFCPLQDGCYQLPDTGLNAIDKSYFLNHSKYPNMITENDGDTFIAARDIEIDEELTVDYNTYDEQPDEFKN